MGSLYREYFYVPENGKCREKVMITRVITTTVIMLFCLFAMSFTAYAYFTAPVVATPSSFIGSAKYDLDIQVTAGNSPVELTEENTFIAEAGKEYTVSLKYVEGSAQTGFCGIKIDKLTYHTEQIGADIEAEDEFRDETKFTIAIEGTGNILVELIPHWGTSSYYEAYVPKEEEIIEEADAEEAEDKEDAEETDDETVEENPWYVVKDDVITIEIVDGIIPETYVVQTGDTLWKISQLFETTVEKLVAYNGITNRSVLPVGCEIKIPPADWQIPKEQSKKPSETTPPTTTTKPPVTTTVPTTSESTPPADKTESTPEADKSESTETKNTEITPAEETNS